MSTHTEDEKTVSILVRTSEMRGDHAADVAVAESHVLNSKGQCCGRKPIVYKLDDYRFCSRCDRTYHSTENRQLPNWAWAQKPDGTWFFKCQRCAGKGHINVGDDEVGNVYDTCPKCGGSGEQPAQGKKDAI